MIVTHSDGMKLPYGMRLEVTTTGLSVTPYRIPADFETAQATATPGEDFDAALAGKHILVGPTLPVVFADLVERWEVQDYSCVVFPFTKDSTPQIGYPHNRYSETVSTKRDTDATQRYQEHAALHLFVPFVADPSTWALHVITHPDCPLLYSGTVTEMARPDALRQAMPTLALSGDATVPAGGYASVTAQLRDAAGVPLAKTTTLYLEETGGYLTRRRLPLVNGTGSFKVGAIGLDAGETFKVKAGFRLYSGLSEINFTVV